MKTNYNYFLRRRNLTTKAIIEFLKIFIDTETKNEKMLIKNIFDFFLKLKIDI